MAPTRSTAHVVTSEEGFSLPELLIATALLLIISSSVTSGLLQITNSQKTIANRVDLHAGVRSATELMQQEIGQAGRIALPGTATLAAAIGTGVQTVGINQTIGGVTALNVSGFFVNEQIVVDAGDLQRETVTVTGVDTVAKTVTANFAFAHNAGVPVNVYGGFATGIVPPTAVFGATGSTGTTLKLYGDVNGDGNMVYVEYSCNPQAAPGGNFYRNVMAYDVAPPKPAANQSQVLLTGILANPGNTPCFTYMLSPAAVSGNWYVLDVAITLTVQTNNLDPVTRQYQTETKALLNVSPRNVFDVWQLASIGITNRVQPMPQSVTNLLP